MWYVGYGGSEGLLATAKGYDGPLPKGAEGLLRGATPRVFGPLPQLGVTEHYTRHGAAPRPLREPPRSRPLPTDECRCGHAQQGGPTHLLHTYNKT